MCTPPHAIFNRESKYVHLNSLLLAVASSALTAKTDRIAFRMLYLHRIRWELNCKLSSFAEWIAFWIILLCVCVTIEFHCRLNSWFMHCLLSPFKIHEALPMSNRKIKINFIVCRALCAACTTKRATHMHTEAEKTASKYYTARADNYIVELEFIFGDFIFLFLLPSSPVYLNKRKTYF